MSLSKHEMKRLRILLPALLVCGASVFGQSNAPTITIDASQRDEQPDTELAGSFQQIQYAADFMRNGDFEQWDGNSVRPGGAGTAGPQGWALIAQGGSAGEIARVSDNPVSERNPHSMRLNVTAHKGRVGVVNSGSRGVNVREGEWYDLAFHARTEPTTKTFGLVVSLESPDGQIVCARATIPEVGGRWREYKLPLQARQSHPAARVVIAMPETGTIWFDQVTLFPRLFDELFAKDWLDLAVKTDVHAGATSNSVPGLRAQAALDREPRELIVMIANARAEAVRAELAVAGVTGLRSGRMITVPTAGGTTGSPRPPSPGSSEIRVSGLEFPCEFAPHSLTILRLPTSGETR
jgi:hypothetical protein